MQALSILSTSNGLTAREFAERMWPNSEKWSKSHNVGTNGATRGVGMQLAGGSYLAKLRNAGLVYVDIRNTVKIFFISLKGKKIVAECHD